MTNGVLFRHAPFAPSDVMANEYIKGHLPLDNLEFAPMEKYGEELRHDEFTITVQDVSTNYILNVLTNWTRIQIV